MGMGTVTVRHDDHGVDVEMTVPPEIAALFGR